MKTYLITVHISEEVMASLEGDLWWAEDSKNEEDIATCKEDIDKAKNWEKAPIPITTLEEYFSLLSEISDFCDGDYHIYNDGQWISVGE